MEVSLDTLSHYAADFVTRLPKQKGKTAYIVGIKGELGAGKTTFVQHIATVLGVRKIPTSPTFTLLQTYLINHPPFCRLVHVDAYRLSPHEKDTIGWSGYAKDPKNLILVEWPERLPGFPKVARTLTLKAAREDSRTVIDSGR